MHTTELYKMPPKKQGKQKKKQQERKQQQQQGKGGNEQGEQQGGKEQPQRWKQQAEARVRLKKQHSMKVPNLFPATLFCLAFIILRLTEILHRLQSKLHFLFS